MPSFKIPSKKTQAITIAVCAGATYIGLELAFGHHSLAYDVAMGTFLAGIIAYLNLKFVS